MIYNDLICLFQIYVKNKNLLIIIKIFFNFLNITLYIYYIYLFLLLSKYNRIKFLCSITTLNMLRKLYFTLT